MLQKDVCGQTVPSRDKFCRTFPSSNPRQPTGPGQSERSSRRLHGGIAGTPSQRLQDRPWQNARRGLSSKVRIVSHDRSTLDLLNASKKGCRFFWGLGYVETSAFPLCALCVSVVDRLRS